MMKRLLLFVSLATMAISAKAQTPKIPGCAAEDKDGIMAAGYWEIWNDDEQKRIDEDIEAYRKADAVFKTGRIKKGTKVKVEQTASEFVFGASAFNWNQLGSYKANAAYRNVFGTLFNRATIPFYWKDFEPVPGRMRFEESVIDTEKWWNICGNTKFQPNWRRPATDPIVKWCNDHKVAVHGHPLVWGSRKWQYPTWMQYDGVPENERRALDSLEIIIFSSGAKHVPSYKTMSEEEIAAILPEYLKHQEQRTLQRAIDIMDRYKGRVQSWDVVNESAWDFRDGLQDPSLPMCKSRYGILFSDYTYKAFKAVGAHRTDGSLLNINDYATDDSYPSQIEDLLSRGAEINVIGSQMHLFSPQQCLDIAAGKHLKDKSHDRFIEPEQIRGFFSKFEKFGIPVCLSEITITSAGNGERGEMIQAIIARNLYRMWFSVPNMMGITWWNVVDDCGAPGEPTISGIFHRDMSPKTVYYALDQLINHEWRTNVELTPDSKGNISWRGFKGTYLISWTDAKGVAHSEELIISGDSKSGSDSR